MTMTDDPAHRGEVASLREEVNNLREQIVEARQAQNAGQHGADDKVRVEALSHERDMLRAELESIRASTGAVPPTGPPPGAEVLPPATPEVPQTEE